MLELYANIKKIREARGMSQDELAKMVGFKSRSSINKIELGVNDITQSKLVAIAKALHVSVSELMGDDKQIEPPLSNAPTLAETYRIPVLGSISAGVPIEASEDIVGYEYLSEKYKGDGCTYFALRVQGRSMEPTIMDGDTVIVRQQPTVESGEIAVVLINGDSATAKEVKESPEGITLIGHNAAVYSPHPYSNKEIEELPVMILGKVIEIRRHVG